MTPLADTYKTDALELEEHDQLTTRTAQRCGLSERRPPGSWFFFPSQITYRLLLQPESSLLLTGACLSVACPGEGYAK